MLIIRSLCPAEQVNYFVQSDQAERLDYGIEAERTLRERSQRPVKRPSHLPAVLALLWFAYLALVVAHQLPEIPLPEINIAQYVMQH